MEWKSHRTSEGKAAKLSEIVRLKNEKHDRDKSTDHDERNFWVLQNGIWGKLNESCVMDAPIIKHIHGRKKEVILEWSNPSSSIKEDDQKANATNASTQNDINPKNSTVGTKSPEKLKLNSILKPKYSTHIQSNVSQNNEQQEHNSSNLLEKQNEMKTQIRHSPAMSLVKNNPKCSIGFIV